MSDDNVKSVECPPDWDGMRRWVLAMYETDPDKAKEIAEGMGSEAPEFPTIKRVIMSIGPNQGYAPDQIKTKFTLEDLKEKVEDAIRYYGGDCVIVTHDSSNRYGASYGKLYNEEFMSEEEWGEDE